jgi:hypothetical protein
MKDVSQTGVLAPESVAEQEAERTMSQIVSWKLMFVFV